MVECACGCGTRITRKGKNGKPRKYLRGHQTRGRKMVDRSSEAYWENRVRRMNTSAPLCRCGCGNPVTITVSWLKQASENGTRPVWRPKYVEGHMPQVPCGCGCGTLVDILDVRGQPRSCVPSHAGRLSTPPEKVDWESRTSEWNQNAPDCACGCGKPLVRTVGQMRAYIPDPDYLPGHNQRKACVLYMTPEEESFIYGSLLGDGCLTRSATGTPRFVFTHGASQKAYAEHKIEVLSRFGASLRRVENAGFGDTSYQGRTSCMPLFESVWDVVRRDGKKQVNPEWLSKVNPRGLAYWFMDDGSVQRNHNHNNKNRGQVYNAALHTEGFSEQENHLLSDFLSFEYGVGAQVKQTRDHFYLYIPRKSAVRLLEVVEPYLHESMAYKGVMWLD